MQNKNTILIVDDEPAAREALEALLAAEGYELEFAVDGLQGLTRAAELSPDLILLDVMMPGIDGFEVCRRLRTDQVLAEVPVVMITALDDQESRLDGIEAGADDFITKPFDKSELRARVRAICRLNRYRLLLAERDRFQWIVEQSQDGYLVLDQSGKILYANPQAQLYLNLAEETSNLTFIDVISQQYHCEPESALQEWKTQLLLEMPNYWVRPETSTARAFWLQTDQIEYPQSTGLRRVVRLRDVTKIITNQQDLRLIETSLRHKLLTPVSNAYMSLYLVKNMLSKVELPDPEFAKMVTDAVTNMEHLNLEMKDIFKYMDAPVIAQFGQQIPLSQLPVVVTLIAGKLQLNKVTVTVPVSLQTRCLTISQMALESILWELLENAKKFHPQHTPQVDINVSSTLRYSQFIQMQIHDDGISLSPEQIKSAITPYIQNEKHFSGEQSGMGLGLSMVSVLVWQVGGHIRLFNRNDRPGVVVSLLLPLASE